MAKPGTPKGTRDFLPQVMVRRNYIFNTIRSVFQKYGYAPIETPAMENLETLTGKYGDEGDKLIFKILNSGDYLSKANNKAIDNRNSSELVSSISEKALRYDLTVPFARFVVQHQNELSFPFKRYQIQPVWRADRPQKGRYREFYQCDADVVGSDSLLNEVELIQIFDEVFTALEIPVVIKINNRKLLSALATYLGEEKRLVELTVAIDKLDKIPREKVLDELKDADFDPEVLSKLDDILQLAATVQSHDEYGSKQANYDFLLQILEVFHEIPEGEKGIHELQYILDKIYSLGLKSAKLSFDLSLARGLNYYTGAIFEVQPVGDVQVGSICGGGRYDDLTGIFGMPGMSGVGISFGADRIYDILEALEKFPAHQSESSRIFFVNFGETEADHCLKLLKKVREAGINAELYPENAKMQKQMKYAHNKNIAFVAMVGENEIKSGIISLKEMDSGEQFKLTIEELIKKIS